MPAPVAARVDAPAGGPLSWISPIRPFAESPVVARTVVHRLALAAILALTAPLAAAQMYKWTDKDGKVQYSDRPPPDAKTSPVQSTVGSVTGGGSARAQGDAPQARTQAPLSIAEKDQAFRKRQMEAEEARTKQVAAEKHAKERTEQCGQARNRLAGLEAGGRIARFNEKGERVFLDDGQIEAEKGRIRKDVASLCK